MQHKISLLDCVTDVYVLIRSTRMPVVAINQAKQARTTYACKLSVASAVQIQPVQAACPSVVVDFGFFGVKIFLILLSLFEPHKPSPIPKLMS